jgi:hypothetical protein
MSESDEEEAVPTLEQYAASAEILEFALARVKEDRKAQREYLAACEEQLLAARMLYHEATIAERELERLLHGGDSLYLNEAELDAEVYPDAAWDRSLATLAREPVALTPPLEPEPIPKPAEPERLPLVLVKQLSPKFVAENNIEPIRGPYRERVDYAAVGEKIMAALDEMLALWPTELDGQKVAKHLGLTLGHAYQALRDLDLAGRLQYLKRLDSSQIIVLRLGEPMPHADLTKNQRLVFDWLAAHADADGMVSASIRTIEQGVGCAKQTAASTIWPLSQKGWIEIVDKGDGKNAATYRIVEAHRILAPEPEEPAPEEAPAAAETQPELSAEIGQLEPPAVPVGALTARQIAKVRAFMEQGYSLRGAAAAADVDLKAAEVAFNNKAGAIP